MSSGPVRILPAQACRFCWSEDVSVREFYDRPLLETEHFVVVPSLGAFIDGWVLVVPKHHALNLRELDTGRRREFAILERRVRSFMTNRYGSVVSFEHGPAMPGTAVGCGVDHAHLHLVPYERRLRLDVERVARGALQFESVDSIFESRCGQDRRPYIYLREASGEQVLGFADEIGSQLVRRVLASRTGQPQRFNWRGDFALDGVQNTVAAFAGS